MKLSKQSWHYRLQAQYYTKPDTQDGCKYFWRIVFSLMVFVWTLPSRLVRFDHSIVKANKSYESTGDITVKRIGGAVGVNVLCLACYIGGWSWLETHPIVPAYIQPWIALFVGLVWLTIFVVSILAAIFGTGLICMGCSGLSEKFFSKRASDEADGDNFVIEFFKGVKNRYCPRIEWED